MNIHQLERDMFRQRWLTEERKEKLYNRLTTILNRYGHNESQRSGRLNSFYYKFVTQEIQKQCDEIARSTRRGKGNILICSAEAAAVLRDVVHLN